MIVQDVKVVKVGQYTDSPTSTPSSSPTSMPSSSPTGAPSSSPTSAPTSMPSGSPTGVPSSSPTSKPTATPTAKPTYPEGVVIKLGNNGSPSDVFPLGRCQGDCDDDNDCLGDLVCMENDNPPPGCTGTPNAGTEYCYDPNDDTRIELEKVGNNGSPADAFPLQVCQGDCDTDDECEGDLVCAGEDVIPPECKGSPDSNIEYCMFWDPMEFRYLGPNPDVILTMCQGDCDSDSDCEGDLTCMDAVDTGCIGTPVTSLPITYCGPAVAPTDSPTGPTSSPTDSPTSSPTDSHSPTETPPPFQYLGRNPSQLLAMCQGDCDNDSDCEGDLVCMDRGDAKCTGTSKRKTDYCFPRDPNSFWKVGSNPSVILTLCQGNCDNDDDCEGDLVCMDRGNAGCTGTSVRKTDYCYYPDTI